MERDRLFNMPKSAYTDWLHKYNGTAEETETLAKVFKRNDLTFKDQARDIEEDNRAWAMRFSNESTLKDKYQDLGRRLHEYCESYGYHPDFNDPIMNNPRFKEHCKPLIPRIGNVLPWTIAPENLDNARIEVEYTFMLSKFITTMEGRKFFGIKERIKEDLIMAVDNDKQIREEYDDTLADRLILGQMDEEAIGASVYDIPFAKLASYNKEATRYI
ncbi:hypothetical protein QSE00_20970 [Arenibacter sp. M-2]|uniref:hypothetical protein n=1 Tax=Arenibacter sp. M-2 TaxID=3053612 RepID=UPI002571181D|nr:hypothetical protein [Arenibacter sp. M-2]MDL5514299.1 hypothetical protein [Arenibacter sp. M-2]